MNMAKKRSRKKGAAPAHSARPAHAPQRAAHHARSTERQHPLLPGILHAIFSQPRPVPQKAAPEAEHEPKPAKGRPHKKSVEPAEPNPSIVRLYRRFTAAMPRGLVNHFEKKMQYAGVNPEQSAILLGRAILTSVLTGAIPLMLYLVIFNPITNPVTVGIAIALFFGGMLASLILHYLWLYYKVADRSSFVEKLLPDFLSLTVSNLRAGMSPYAAFVHAARPEFGPFHDAVVQAMAKISGKGSVDQALLEVSENFDSAILRRTVTLFAKGMSWGASSCAC